ncbi:MAG: HEPN domain-containing protein [Deltaproteobacteria bacterium]|nr:HEPN domain-containing protein [Deltaproteobacteria bacterium]
MGGKGDNFLKCLLKQRPLFFIMIKLNRIINRFVSDLRKRLGERIIGIYLFGSSAKGTATEESDIDVLVVYSDIEERSLLEIASEISFKIACEEGSFIETIPMSRQEFEQSLGRSPFLWEVLQFGKPIFTTLSGTEWELDFKDYLSLAEEYLNYGKDALNEHKLRLSIDSGYNSCELLVKALIINTKNSLASSHGGLIVQFSKLFILNKKLPEYLGRNLNLALDLRAKARYKPGAQLQVQDAEFIINLCDELLQITKKRLDEG